MKTKPIGPEAKIAACKGRLDELESKLNSAKRAAKLAKLRVRSAKSEFKDAKRIVKELRQQVRACGDHLDGLAATKKRPKR